MKPLKIIWILAILTAILAGCGYSKEQLEGEYSSGYEGGYDNRLKDDRTEGWNKAAKYSYKEGFQHAVNFSLDRMDEEYREQWWEENIEEIMEIGLEY